MRTAQEFRAFFEAIPDEKWSDRLRLAYDDDGVGCAVQHVFGHAHTLANIVSGNLGECVGNINDGRDERFLQPTPKARILAALDSIIAKEAATP